VTPRELTQAIDALAAQLPQLASVPKAVLSSAITAVDLARTLASERDDAASAELLYWIEAVQRAIASHARDLAPSAEETAHLERRLLELEKTAQALANAMEFGFLFDRSRRLLSIGYLVSEDRLDTNCYDLLASEARLASFIAIAKGDVPVAHWFQLGRPLTPVRRGAALISWSGSMFEYLMPSLVMRAPFGSLLEKTNQLVVRRQIQYAAGLGLPWGISESAYNARDKELTYQYSNFGVPGLGFKRGLGENVVIAPYATALAAMVDPAAAVAELAIKGRGTPRLAIRMLEATRRVSRAEGADAITIEHVRRMMEIEGVDGIGLDDLEQRYLSILAASTTPVRLNVIATMPFGCTPAARRRATRPAMRAVLPLPAPASTRRLRSWSDNAAMRANASGRLLACGVSAILWLLPERFDGSERFFY
jgi:hypothetical protein